MTPNGQWLTNTADQDGKLNLLHLSSYGAVRVGVMTVMTFVCPKSSVALLSSRENCAAARRSEETGHSSDAQVPLFSLQKRYSPGM